MELFKKNPLFWWGSRIFSVCDILLLVFYICCCFLTAAFFPLPKIAHSSQLLLIPLVFFCTLIAGIISSRYIFRKGVAPLKGHILTFSLLFWVVALAFVALLASWAVGVSQFGELIVQAPSFGMRAVFTSLHPLVPLESRLLFTVFPLVLLYPMARNSRVRSTLVFCALILTAAVVQIKLGFLFIGVFAVYYFLSPLSFVAEGSRSRFVWIIICAMVGVAGLVFIRTSIGDVAKVLSSPLLPSLPSVTSSSTVASGVIMAEQARVTGETAVCEGYQSRRPPILDDSPDEGPLGLRAGRFLLSFAHNLLHRSFGLSSEVVRLFVCLRDHGWHPAFRGHQLFRLFGGYVPYYRLAYREFRPKQGSAVSSAVSNVTADAFFNLGWTGVVVAGFLVGFCWACLFGLTANPEYRYLLFYFRFYFVSVLAQGSLLSGLVTLVPLGVVLAWDRILCGWRAKYPASSLALSQTRP